jgi:hypothetical protein
VTLYVSVTVCGRDGCKGDYKVLTMEQDIYRFVEKNFLYRMVYIESDTIYTIR